MQKDKWTQVGTVSGCGASKEGYTLPWCLHLLFGQDLASHFCWLSPGPLCLLASFDQLGLASGVAGPKGDPGSQVQSESGVGWCGAKCVAESLICI